MSKGERKSEHTSRKRHQLIPLNRHITFHTARRPDPLQTPSFVFRIAEIVESDDVFEHAGECQDGDFLRVEVRGGGLAVDEIVL